MYQKRISEIERRILYLENYLVSLPEGKLLCKKNRENYQYYISNSDKPIYIPKKQNELAQQLAVRQIYEIEIKMLLQEKKNIERYLKSKERLLDNYSHILNEKSPQTELKKMYLNQYPIEIKEWANASYIKSQEFPERLVHRTKKNEMVRSKSEQKIADYLYDNGIPYRYECQLILDGKVFYPDFTILHPQKRKIMYWEHFGIMDSQDYINKVYSKLKIYSENSIIPSINLITTYETLQNPLYSGYVQLLIDEFLK